MLKRSLVCCALAIVLVNLAFAQSQADKEKPSSIWKAPGRESSTPPKVCRKLSGILNPLLTAGRLLK